jgi:hypothetical protein
MTGSPPPLPDPQPSAVARRSRGRALAPAAAAVAVVLAVTGGYLLQRGVGGDGPPTLRLLDDGRAGAEDAAAAAAPADAPGGRYRVAGSLPDGPSHGHVHTLAGGRVAEDAVRRLAAALGLDGDPARQADGWLVRSAERSLWVLDAPGTAWFLGDTAGMVVSAGECEPSSTSHEPTVVCATAAPGKVIPVEPDSGARPPAGAVPGATPGDGAAPGSAGSATGARPPAADAPDRSPAAGAIPGSAAPGGGGGSAAPGSGAGDPGGAVAVPAPAEPRGPAPSEALVRAAAAPLLAALGLRDAPVRVHTYAGMAAVTVTRTVDGLPAAGYETVLVYDGRLRLRAANGWLAEPARGAEYPLVSARRALDAMPAPPEIALYCEDDVDRSCQQQPLVITGAEPGLMLRHAEGGSALLVPAWLFAVRGHAEPLPAVAVDPAYLAPPRPAGGDTADGDLPVSEAPAPPANVTPRPTK